MEDEVRKHVKNIQIAAANPGHSFWEKLKEILIEIFIIVFAVSLSIWFHNWSDHRHEMKAARAFLAGLQKDLKEDSHQIARNKSLVMELTGMYDSLYEMPNTGQSAKDDSFSYRFIVSIITTRPNLGRYEGFKSSGKLESIEDDSLKQNILRYFQQATPDLSITENFINSMQLKILDELLDKPGSMTERKLMASAKMKGNLSLVIQNFQSITAAYDETLRKINQIIVGIDRNIRE